MWIFSIIISTSDQRLPITRCCDRMSWEPDHRGPGHRSSTLGTSRSITLLRESGSMLSRSSRRRAVVLRRPVSLGVLRARRMAVASRSRFRGPGRVSRVRPGERRAIMAPPRAVRDFPMYAPPVRQRTEEHAFDTVNWTIAATDVPTAPVELLNGILGGDDINNRIARRVQMHSVAIRGEFYSGGATLRTNCVIMVVYDRQTPLAAVPLKQDILLPTGPDGHEAVNNRDRFQIIYRKQVVVIGNVASGFYTDSQMRRTDEKIVLNRLAVWPDLATAQPSFGALWLFIMSDTPAGAAAALWHGTVRVTFSDA